MNLPEDEHAGSADQPSDEPSPDEATSPTEEPSTEESAKPVSRSMPSATRTSKDSGPDEQELREDLEYENQRNDFMLRWTVVLLALLAASTTIRSTTTLVHVRSGEHLLENGLLPPRTDPFSTLAADRPWANTEWLFDVSVAAIHGVAGPVGLTVTKALLVALAFGLLVHVNRPGSSSWWGSICAAVAVMVCASRFTVLPEAVTLLGLSVVLWLFLRWRQSDATGPPWALIPLFVVWANLDSRVYLGLAVLVLYGVGEVVSRLLDSPAAFDTSAKRSSFWIVTIGCVAATMCNPFGWATLTAPVEYLTVYYPEMRELVTARLPEDGLPSVADQQYFPLFSRAFLRQPDVQGVCGLFLIVVAFVAAAMNHRRLDVGTLFVLAGFTLFAAAAQHELAAAAVVAAVLGTLAAQQWQASSDGPVSTGVGAVAFARGGRAVTVLGFIGIAALAIGGRLRGPADEFSDSANRGLGLGFDPSLQVRLDGLESALDGLPPEYTAFHSTRRQGDCLIWLGRKSFVDGRVRLFAGGPENLYEKYDALRQSLADDAGVKVEADAPAPASVLDEYAVDFVVEDLPGETLTRSYAALVASPLWQIYEVGADESIMLRTRPAGTKPSDSTPADRREFVEKRREFARENLFNPLASTFSNERDPVGLRIDVAQPPTEYGNWLVPDRRVTTPELERARQLRRHLNWVHQERFGRLPLELSMGFGYLTLNEANTALVDDSQQADAYTVLGQIRWYFCNKVEPVFTAGGQAQNARHYTPLYEFRRMQAINEFAQALRVNPDDIEARAHLLSIYLGSGRIDLAAYHRDELARVLSTEPETNEALEALIDPQAQLDRMTRIQEVRKKAFEDLQNTASPLTVASKMLRDGCFLAAIEVLDQALVKDPKLATNPQVLEFAVATYLEAGQLENALRELARLQQRGESLPPSTQRLVAVASAAAGRHEQAIEALTAAGNVFRTQRDQALFEGALAFVSAPFQIPSAEVDGWVAGLPVRAKANTTVVIDTSRRIANTEATILLLQLESGRIADARETAESFVENHADSGLLGLVDTYGRLLGYEPDIKLPDDVPPEPPATGE